LKFLKDQIIAVILSNLARHGRADLAIRTELEGDHAPGGEREQRELRLHFSDEENSGLGGAERKTVRRRTPRKVNAKSGESEGEEEDEGESDREKDGLRARRCEGKAGGRESDCQNAVENGTMAFDG
jgi:hypothetical protein